MRISDIQRCDIRPGRLVEWTFSPATIAAAAVLPPDPRPPAYIQESHIRTARSVREDGLFVPTWLGAAFDLPCQVDLDALEQALRDWTLRHETLRSGFRWSGDDMQRFTLDEDDVTLRREVVGDYADAELLIRYLQDRFDAAADALGWPNLIYAAVVRENCTSVYLAFDHTNVDAYSLQRIPDEIHELYTARLTGRSVAGTPVGSYVDFCEQERANADAIDDTHTIVSRWREFIGRCDGRLPEFPVDLGLEPGGVLPAQKLVREPLVDADAAAAFETYCRPYGGSLVGILAATSLIVHELGGQPVYRTVVPFHTRLKSAWSESVGWYVGGAPIEVPAARDFDGALASVRAELQANRSLARIPLARVLRLLGKDFRPTSPDMYSIISYVDARLVPGSVNWAEQKAYGLLRVSYGDQVCAWVNRLHEGLWLACRYPDTDIAYKNVCLYVEKLRDLILAVSARPHIPGPKPSSV
ncbi:Condensation domain-containing protein [Streptomyces sp. 1222.5]|uniref:condensation domain-containing protein n=1 Tax=unclassified Streptomyces TaxID=2593676 RepID=UPI00089D9CC8|nr:MULTISPECIES: condensation domain-containing protein [unclassified Streptomyces]PKW05058.1 condensation domain-containing protein [Streptomyces sp. 5112.2]SEB53979.1 Condensation domain-containing protein [Streptomyces sp. 1222.5]SEC02902.1 Condensation domain-containing protein [Streptomyces sp. 2231.1]